MSLKAKIESIDGLAEDIVAHYAEKTVDGVKAYYLQVGAVDGLVLENVDALKNTITTLRKSEKTLRKDIDAGENALRKHEAKFEGIDPDAAKNALGKIDDIKTGTVKRKSQRPSRSQQTKPQRTRRQESTSSSQITTRKSLA